MKPLVMCLLFLGVLLGGCGKSGWFVHPDDYVTCDPAGAERRAVFVIDCITAANPKSDEEPEDWLHICEAMAKRSLCVSEPGFYYANSGTRKTVTRPCREAKLEDEKTACGGEDDD
jgi:hypothetical protein